MLLKVHFHINYEDALRLGTNSQKYQKGSDELMDLAFSVFFFFCLSEVHCHPSHLSRRHFSLSQANLGFFIFNLTVY